MLPIIALAGSKLVLKKSTEKSLWLKWGDKINPDMAPAQIKKGWIVNFFSWTFKSGNLWAIFLLPFILIVKATEDPSSTTSPELAMIYTLF